MTTYCIDPNATWIAVYNLNTGTMPTKNVVRSEITGNLSASGTTITVKTGEGALFVQGMIATLEQIGEDGEHASAREVVLISGVSGDTLTLTRGYENCVVDDFASPKELGNTPLAFDSGARISVYISRALLNGVQTRLEQVNKPCNTAVYNEALAVSSCVNSNYNAWCDCLVDTIIKCCYCDTLGDGALGDCVLSGNVFLNADCEYNFENLTIEEGALVRFTGCGTPIIRVRKCFCNMGTIDLRGGTFVGCCSRTDTLTGCSVANNKDLAAFTAMCWGCGGHAGGGRHPGAAGCPAASSTCGGAGGKGGDGYTYCGYYGCPGCPAEGPNGGRGGDGEYGGSGAPGGGGGGGGGGADFGNGGDAGYAGSGRKSCYYEGGAGGGGGNSGIWGRGGNGSDAGSGDPANDWSKSCGGKGGNGYIGGSGGSGYGTRVDGDYQGFARGGNGGKGIICGGNGGGHSSSAYMGCGGHGGDAINNMYALILYACSVYNNCINGQGGKGGNGGYSSINWNCAGSGVGGNGGCGANGGHIVFGYYKSDHLGDINVCGGCGGCKGGTNCACNQPGVDGVSGCAGTKVVCHITF